ATALHTGFPRVRAAAGDSHGQRTAVCVEWGGWAEPAGGPMGQARDQARAHRTGHAAAEWTARAHSPYAQGADGTLARRNRARAATPLRSLPRALQPRAAARGA